jgi:hypothetical protein
MSMMGKRALGIALVAGNILVPHPAIGMTAFRIFISLISIGCNEKLKCETKSEVCVSETNCGSEVRQLF